MHPEFIYLSTFGRSMQQSSLLEINGLSIQFRNEGALSYAVEDVSFSIEKRGSRRVGRRVGFGKIRDRFVRYPAVAATGGHRKRTH